MNYILKDGFQTFGYFSSIYFKIARLIAQMVFLGEIFSLMNEASHSIKFIFFLFD